MNSRDLADRIGNIDDRLVQQAERLPNYRAQHRRKVFTRFAACAAAVLLMFGSFVTGAVAFSGLLCTAYTIVNIPLNTIVPRYLLPHAYPRYLREMSPDAPV